MDLFTATLTLKAKKAKKMLVSVITTINSPSIQVRKLSAKHSHFNLGKIIIVGDQKGPLNYELEGTKLLSLKKQTTLYPSLSKLIPENHYARKNLGYLEAIKTRAGCIYETDDDNSPLESWVPRTLEIQDYKRVIADKGWVNIYKYFTAEHIWPRGLPLNEIKNEAPRLEDGIENQICPIQQGLVNHSPDVDAIWRLSLDRPFNFNNASMGTVVVPKGVWSPFNTQSTWWWPVAYPLLYIPSYTTFRMCDIWKSFVAQRCLWELGHGIAFHSPEVIQDRNEHDLMSDFEDEIPGYLYNHKIAESLNSLRLESGADQVANNLLRCYQSLVSNGFIPDKELEIIEAWCVAVDDINLGS